MNYKKIIPSRKLRLWILSLLDIIPDKLMVRLQYRIHLGRALNFKTPVRLTEKLQIYKLYYRNPIMPRCTDKIEVRKVIEEMGLQEILIPLVGIFDFPNQIVFDKLPSRFVIKTTDGGGGNQVLVCHDKSKLDKEMFFKTLHSWMKMPQGKSPGREWAYDNDKPRRLIIEQLIYAERPGSAPDCILSFDDNNQNPTVEILKDNPETISTSIIHQLKTAALSVGRQSHANQVSLYNTSKNIWYAEPIATSQNNSGKPTGREFIIYDDQNGPHDPGLIDYKFICLNGKISIIYVCTGRHLGSGVQIGIYTPQWEKLPVKRSDELEQTYTVPKPVDFEKMKQIAEQIASNFPYVRVDLYNVNHKIYFGELTFYDGSGYFTFSPDEFDARIGKDFDITSFYPKKQCQSATI